MKTGTLFSKRIQDQEIEIFVDDSGSIRATKNGLPVGTLGLPMSKVETEEEFSEAEHFLNKKAFINPLGQFVDINARKKGGWYGTLHRGYKEQGEEIVPRTGRYGEQGTYQWAREFGWAESQAQKLADECFAVDDGDTDPVWRFFSTNAQSYHFNINDTSVSSGGSEEDSRIEHAVDYLKKALKTRVNDKRLRRLAKGLHALQDIPAHADDFVGFMGFYYGFYHHGFAKGKGADEPSFEHPYKSPISKIPDEKTLNVRYSNTKTATYIYLTLYQELMKQPIEGWLDKIKKRITANTNASDFLGFLSALKNKFGSSSFVIDLYGWVEEQSTLEVAARSSALRDEVRSFVAEDELGRMSDIECRRLYHAIQETLPEEGLKPEDQILRKQYTLYQILYEINEVKNDHKMGSVTWEIYQGKLREAVEALNQVVEGYKVELPDDQDRLLEEKELLRIKKRVERLRFIIESPVLSDWHKRLDSLLIDLGLRSIELSEEKGSTVQIWKQDPSVRAIGVRTAYIPSSVQAGPKDARIMIKGMPVAEKDPNGDFLFDRGEDPEKFDAVHTFSVVRQALTMYQRILRELGGANEGLLDKWEWGNDPIRVRPHAGERANAYYSRGKQCLRFFYFSDQQNNPVHTCQSFDVVAHETGHAILDVLRPGYWNSMHVETAGLHESFGDLTAIFLMLSQLDQCEAIIVASKGNLQAKNTFFNIIAEQFGQALGYPKGLRNADQDITMRQAGSECHALSRVFTGAIYDITADVFESVYNPKKENPAETLFHIGKTIARIVIQAILLGPSENATYSNIAGIILELAPDVWKGFVKEQFARREVFDVRGEILVFDDATKVKYRGQYRQGQVCCGTFWRKYKETDSYIRRQQHKRSAEGALDESASKRLCR